MILPRSIFLCNSHVCLALLLKTIKYQLAKLTYSTFYWIMTRCWNPILKRFWSRTAAKSTTLLTLKLTRNLFNSMPVLFHNFFPLIFPHPSRSAMVEEVFLLAF